MSEIFQRHNRYIPSNVEKLVNMKYSDLIYRLERLELCPNNNLITN